MRNAVWIVGSAAVLFLVGGLRAQEIGQDRPVTPKDALAALHRVWEKVVSREELKKGQGRMQLMQLRIDDKRVEVRHTGPGGLSDGASMELSTGEVAGIKVLVFRVLGQSGLVAYEIDGDEMTLVPGRGKLLGGAGSLFRGEWVRVKENPR
jgi:hypothetical protein